MKRPIHTTTMSILESVVLSENPFTKTLPVNEFRIFEELRDSGHISGQIGTGLLSDPPTMVENVRMTTSGRLLLEQLRKEKKESSFWSTAWRRIGPVIGFVAGGIVAPLIIKYIEKHL